MLDVEELFERGQAALSYSPGDGKHYDVNLYLLAGEVRAMYNTLIYKGDLEAEFIFILDSLVLVNEMEVYHLCVWEPETLGLFVKLHTLQMEISVKGHIASMRTASGYFIKNFIDYDSASRRHGQSTLVRQNHGEGRSPGRV